MWGVSPFPPLWWTICWFFSDIGPGSALCGSRLSGNVQLVDRRPTQAGRPSVRRYDFSQCERGCIPRASHMLLISAFPVRNAFLHHLSSILLSDLFVIFEYFCHPHPLFVLSTVPSCKDIQIPHDFRVEINDVSTKPFFKANIEPQQLCAETNVY